MGQIYITSASAGGGKTFVSALLTALCRRSGKTAGVVKLIDTGAQWNEQGKWISGDMEFLMKTAGIPASEIHEVCPYVCVNDMDPVPAAEAGRLSVDSKIMEACAARSEQSHDCSFIDGTGGLSTELVPWYTAADFCRRRGCAVLLVVRTGPGMTDEAVRSCCYGVSRGVPVSAVLLNRTDALPPEVLKAAAADIERITGVPVAGELPVYQDSLSEEKMDAFLRDHSDADALGRLLAWKRTASPVQTVEKALTALLSLQHPREDADTFMDDDYEQITDGHLMNRAALADHLETLQKQCRAAAVQFLCLENLGDSVFSRHRVRVCRRDGGESSFEVMALFRMRDGKILSCTETTKQLSGPEADRDLGSARS